MRSRAVLIALAGLAIAAGCGSGGGDSRAASGGTTSEVPLPARDESHQALPPRPRIVWRRIPYGKRRRSEMAAYAKRHYGIHTWRLIDPHVIVEHYTDNQSFSATYNTFAPDVPDVELHELPGVCSHFVVDRDGTIYQLVSLLYMCRHTVGLNYTAIGIEHVGTSDAQILHNHRQLLASLRLTRYLRCRYGIFVRDVIGHNESLSSPYHRERVARLRHQTHGDWVRSDMKLYRRKLRHLHGC